MKDFNLIHQYSNRGIDFEKMTFDFLFVFNEMFTQSRYNPFLFQLNPKSLYSLFM